MRGNSHVRFLGEKGAAMPLTYPIESFRVSVTNTPYVPDLCPFKRLDPFFFRVNDTHAFIPFIFLCEFVCDLGESFCRGNTHRYGNPGSLGDSSYYLFSIFFQVVSLKSGDIQNTFVDRLHLNVWSLGGKHCHYPVGHIPIQRIIG